MNICKQYTKTHQRKCMSKADSEIQRFRDSVLADAFCILLLSYVYVCMSAFIYVCI